MENARGREKAKAFAENFVKQLPTSKAHSNLFSRKLPFFRKKLSMSASDMENIGEEAFKAGAAEANSQFPERRTALFDRRQLSDRRKELRRNWPDAGSRYYNIDADSKNPKRWISRDHGGRRKVSFYDPKSEEWVMSRRTNVVDERGFRPKESHDLLNAMLKQNLSLKDFLTEQFRIGYAWVSSRRGMPGNDRKRETKFANDKKDETKGAGTSSNPENKKKKNENRNVVNTELVKKVASAAHNHAVSAWVAKIIHLSPSQLKKKTIFAKVNSPEVRNAIENFIRVSGNGGQVVGMRVDNRKYNEIDSHQVSVLIKDNGNQFVLKTFGVPSASHPVFNWNLVPYEAYKKEKRA